MVMPTSSPRAAGRRLLVINPNTNAAMTERIGRAARLCARPETGIDAVNPSSGPFAIESAADREAAVPHVVSLVAASSRQHDGYILACFDDIGVDDIRRLVGAPVVSMAEAGIRAADPYRRFAIVTTVETALPAIVALLAHYDAADRCVVRATGIGVAEASARTESAERALHGAIRHARDEDGAEAIVLGSGAYSGRRAELAEMAGTPVIDGLESAIRYCEMFERDSLRI
jgi:allantoin racemase